MPRFRFSRFNQSVLLLLISLFVFITLFAVIQANATWLWLDPPEWMIEVRLLDTTSSSTILAALIGLQISLRSYNLNHNPLLVYESLQSRQTIKGLIAGEHFWVVHLKNIGGGNALQMTVNVEWQWANVGQVKKGSIGDFRKFAVDKSLVHGTHFDLLNMSGGYALPIQSTITLFEAQLSSLEKLSRFYLHLEFQNVLGDCFRLRVNCLPKA